MDAVFTMPSFELSSTGPTACLDAGNPNHSGCVSILRSRPPFAVMSYALRYNGSCARGFALGLLEKNARSQPATPIFAADGGGLTVAYDRVMIPSGHRSSAFAVLRSVRRSVKTLKSEAIWRSQSVT